MDSNSATTHEATGTTPADWALAWREHLLRSGLEANLRRTGVSEEAFWQRFGKWTETLEREGYPGELLDRALQLVHPADRVLDIGAGAAGTYSIPLAHVVAHVTAVEPSPVQASRLEENVRAAGLENVTVVRSRWEDVDISTLGEHDVVLAVFCFQMRDIRAALEAMCSAARRSLVLIHAASHDLTETLRDLLGVAPGPNYVYLREVLRSMGHDPQVELVARTYRVPLETQLDIFRYNPGLSDDQCRRLRDHLESEGRLLDGDGEVVLERTSIAAFMHVAF
ncbi:class I SAM-dependent methyltransferase [Chloroflexota bacterium]